MNRRRFIETALGASVFLLTGGSVAQRSPFVLGATVSRSGRYAPFAKPVEQALALWAEELDAALAFGGRGVVLRIEDDASDPETARRAYEALALEADALISPHGNRLTEAILPVVEQAGVPCIAPSADSRDLWREPKSWTVQLANPIDTTFRGTLGLAVDEGLATVALVHRNDSWSETVMEGAVRDAREFGMEITSRRRFTNSDEATSAISEADADLLLATGFRQDGEGEAFIEDALMLHAAAVGLRPSVRWLSLGNGASSEEFGLRAHREPDGVLATADWRPYIPTVGNALFTSRYEQRWGELPDAHSARAYAAGELLIESFRRQRDDSPVALRDALFSLTVETAFGLYQVDDSGLQVGKQNAVIQWRDGEPSVVFPPQYRTGTLRM